MPAEAPPRRGWRFAWRGAGRAAPPDPTRWVVVDVEASGLDARHDRLLAIAAVALHRDPAAPASAAPRIMLGDSFELVLRHEAAVVDKPNILLHGIGVGEQRAGVEPDAALAAFDDWLGASPLIGFHAAFDATLIDRAMRTARGRRFDRPWLDLEPLAAVLHPPEPAAAARRSLDDWLARFGLRCAHRHRAAADALATAELLLCLWPAVCAQGGDGDFRSLQRLAAQRRWLDAPLRG